jgi:hypothetical protein
MRSNGNGLNIECKTHCCRVPAEKPVRRIPSHFQSFLAKQQQQQQQQQQNHARDNTTTNHRSTQKLISNAATTIERTK